MPDSVATILVAAGAYGSIVNWPRNRSYETCVSDTAKATDPHSGAASENAPWTSYDPHYWSNLGDQATTFVDGVVKTMVANVRASGKLLFLQIFWSAKLITDARPAYIALSLPPGVKIRGHGISHPCVMTVAGSKELGLATVTAEDSLRFQRFNSELFTSSAFVAGFFTGFIEQA